MCDVHPLVQHELLLSSCSLCKEDRGAGGGTSLSCPGLIMYVLDLWTRCSSAPETGFTGIPSARGDPLCHYPRG